jgi:broad specificity phosphatase PhoE
MPRQLVLVKHAQPILEAGLPPSLWRLGPEGEAQAERLARRLEPFQPLALFSSPEPKARTTAEIVGQQLGLDPKVIDGLEEFDRPALPIMAPEEHECLNARIFADLTTPVIGCESGARARDRFDAAVRKAIQEAPGTTNPVVVAHGTVISLFVAQHNEMDALHLWRRLSCPSFVVVKLPGFDLQQIVDHAA